MPRLIFKCPYIKGGTSAACAHLENYVQYMATRNGVERIDPGRMGADIEGTDDGMIIHGGRPLHGAVIDSHLDHRIAMSFAVAGTICDGTVEILNGECVNISYPEFYHDLYSLDSSRI